jgi:hypothetical protein
MKERAGLSGETAIGAPVVSERNVPRALLRSVSFEALASPSIIAGSALVVRHRSVAPFMPDFQVVASNIIHF